MSRQNMERVLRIVLDITALFLTWCGIFEWPLWSPISFQAQSSQIQGVLPPISYVAMIWLPTAIWCGLYRSAGNTDHWIHVGTSLRASIALACAVGTLCFFWVQGPGRARGVVVLFILASFVSFVLSRLVASAIVRRLARLCPARSRVAVLGCDPEAISIFEHLRICEKNNVRGLIVPEERLESDFGGSTVLGSTRELAGLINREGIDRIVMSRSSISQAELEKLDEIFTRMGVIVSYAVGVPVPARNLNYSERYGLSLLDIQPVRFKAAERIIKRAFDIAGSLIALILAAPLMLLIAVLVKVTSIGPVLFTAPRVGKGGRYFTFLKFRSMHSRSSRSEVAPRNEKDGHLFKIKNDPRLTPVGKFLRRYSLDELPQLFNVLWGDMSLVGPRPLPIQDMEADGMSRRFAIWSEQRASVPPGITGLWQIRGRSELPFHELVKYDLEYVHNWSLGLDLQILLRTPMFVLNGKGAY